MAACVPTMRPLFRKTWDRSTNVYGYSGGSRSADIDANNFRHRSKTQRESVLSYKVADVELTDVGQKEYAESAESQQGIMRTLEVSVQRGSDEEGRISRTEAIVPKELKESQQ